MYDWEADALTATGSTVAAGLLRQNPGAMEISQGSDSQAPGYPGAGSMAWPDAVSLAARYEGTTVVQAIGARLDGAVDVHGQFYVLRGDSVLSGAQVVDPVASTDPTGDPAVQFSLTRGGGRRFERVTAVLARRGQSLSGASLMLLQHFAVAIDNHLIAVLAVDFRQYPDGIPAGEGIQLGGGYLTRQSARTLAVLLRYGPLPVQLALR
jgi:preprotein translocase subunit SecD